MLGDARIQLFVGGRRWTISKSACMHSRCALGRCCQSRLNRTSGPEGVSLDLIIKKASIRQNVDLLLVSERLQRFITHTTPQQLASRIRNGEPLRILGATSRYTTFLQYSMRDWLAGLDALGMRPKF